MWCGARHQSLRSYYIRSAGEMTRPNLKSPRLTMKHRATTSATPFLEFDVMASPERPLTGFKLPPRTTQASEGHTVRVNDVLFPNRGLRRARILLAQLRCIRPSALWQLFRGERQTQIVLTNIDEVRQALDKPQTTRMPASTPIPTPGSPFSSRAIVLGEVPARAARSATAMPRRRRAPRTSFPSLLRAVLAFGELTQSSIYE